MTSPETMVHPNGLCIAIASVYPGPPLLRDHQTPDKAGFLDTAARWIMSW